MYQVRIVMGFAERRRFSSSLHAVWQGSNAKQHPGACQWLAANNRAASLAATRPSSVGTTQTSTALSAA